MKIAIIYASVTGNTEEAARIIHSFIGGELYNIHSFNLSTLEIFLMWFSSAVTHGEAVKYLMK
jgi:flavodoxin